MTGLRQALAGYLELRRGLGFKLERHAELVGQFIGWLEDHGAATVTTADALAWVTLPERAGPGWLRKSSPPPSAPRAPPSPRSSASARSTPRRSSATYPT